VKASRDDMVLHPHVIGCLDEGAERAAQDGLVGRVVRILKALQLHVEGPVADLPGLGRVEGVPHVGLVVVREGHLLAACVEGGGVAREAPEERYDGLADELRHASLALVGPDDGERVELGVHLEDLGAVDRQREGPAVAGGVEGAVLDMAGDGDVDDEAHLVVVPWARPARVVV
jgi:hypothetical protein